MVKILFRAQFKEKFIKEEVVTGKGQKEGSRDTFSFLVSFSLLGDKFMTCVLFCMYSAVTFFLMNNMKDFLKLTVLDVHYACLNQCLWSLAMFHPKQQKRASP